MTTKVNDPQTPPEKTITRFLGSVFGEPEAKVSGSGNEYTRMKVVADNGTPGGAIFWTVIVMKGLKDKLPADLFKARAYAKWVGQASSKPYISKKTGNTETGWDLLLNGVELQSGEFISNKKSEDEDAF